MGSDVGQIFPTASLHRDHSISYALVCEKELSHMGKNNIYLYLVWEKSTVTTCKSESSFLAIYFPLYLIPGQLQVISAFM